jgi:hypothetical protein
VPEIQALPALANSKNTGYLRLHPQQSGQHMGTHRFRSKVNGSMRKQQCRSSHAALNVHQNVFFAAAAANPPARAKMLACCDRVSIR